MFETVHSATTPRSEPQLSANEHHPTTGATDRSPAVASTPDIPMYPPPKNQTPDSGTHASIYSQGQAAHGGEIDSEELRSLRVEIGRLREENGRLHLEVEKSHAGVCLNYYYFGPIRILIFS